METLTFYIGRENFQHLELTQDGDPVNENSVLRAVFRFGNHCLDTDTSALIELYNNAQRLKIQGGLVPNLKVGACQGFLTLYDAVADEKGLPWEHFFVEIREWPVCPV
jgi:hypothetical protein